MPSIEDSVKILVTKIDDGYISYLYRFGKSCSKLKLLYSLTKTVIATSFHLAEKAIRRYLDE